MNDTALQYVLAAIVVLPLLGAVGALLPPPPGLRGRGPDQAVLRHGVTVTGAVLVLAIVLAAGFDHDHPATMQADHRPQLDPRAAASASTSASTASRSPSSC